MASTECTIDKLVNLIAAVKGEHGKLSQELEETEHVLVEVTKELLETEKAILKSQNEEKERAREIAELMVVVEELEAEGEFYHAKQKEYQALVEGVDNEIQQITIENNEKINEFGKTLVSLQQFENDLVEEFDIEKVLLENSRLERTLLQQSKEIEGLEVKFKRNEENASKLNARVEEMSQDCRKISTQNAEQDQVFRELKKERDALYASKDSVVTPETKKLQDQINSARLEKRNLAEVLACMRIEDQRMETSVMPRKTHRPNEFIAEDLSDEEYDFRTVAPRPKKPLPSGPSKQITLVRKKQYKTSNVQRDKKGATFGDLFRNSSSR